MSVRIHGMTEAKRALQKLEKKTARKANRAALRAAGTVLHKANKSATPEGETKALKKAQTSKVSVKGSYGRVMAGADVAKLKEDEARPYNLNYLVENGHVATNGVFVPPTGRMKEAETSAMPAAEARYIAKLVEVIEGDM